MSFDDCITNGNKEKDEAGNKLITDEQKEEALELFNKLDEEYQGKMSRGAAQAPTPGLGATKWLLEGQYKARAKSLGNIYHVGLADLFLATQTETA